MKMKAAVLHTTPGKLSIEEVDIADSRSKRSARQDCRQRSLSHGLGNYARLPASELASRDWP